MTDKQKTVATYIDQAKTLLETKGLAVMNGEGEFQDYVRNILLVAQMLQKENHERNRK